MIIRKPYAFLIKNFKKIHIFLLVLSLYVGYKLFDVNKFVKNYMVTLSYSYQNPIGKHINSILLFSVFLIVIGTVSLIILLMYKKKPWKIYLIPLVEYLSIFLVLRIIKSFFYKLGVDEDIKVTDLRMARDLLTIFLIIQLPAIGIFIMRVLGLDIKKFNFNSDKEFFELSEKDREEFELNFSFDKNTVIRLWKKLIRNINYFYEEHKLICKVIGIVLVVFLGWRLIHFVFVTNKVYYQGQNYYFNGFNIKIGDVYLTDKDYKGDVISSKSKFVIVNINITNYSDSRKFDIDKLHLKRGNKDYLTTRNTYANDFNDLGKAYNDIKEIGYRKALNFIVIYKVENTANTRGFSLYYQESDGFLRKFRISVKDISRVEDKGIIKLGKEMTLFNNGEEEKVTFESYEVTDSVNYSIRTCKINDCRVDKKEYKASSGNKILKITFDSLDLEGIDMFNISLVNGKIIFTDSEGEEEIILFKNPISNLFLGKYIYALVPDDVNSSKTIKIQYTFRNSKYTYQLR